MQRGDRFDSIETASEAIRRYVLDNGEPFKLDKLDKKRFSIACKERGCGLGLRASKSYKEVLESWK